MLSSFPISPALAASDLERARAFYEEVLGFKPHFEYPEGVFYTSGEVSFDEENADAGTFTFERERDLSIENNVRDLLGKIDRALVRMNEGTYGTCSRCGKQIEKARLKALPYVELCLKDAQAQSRR